MNFTLRHYGTHRYRTIGDAFRRSDEIGRDLEALGREGGAGASESGDDFIKDEQDSVRIADRAKSLQIAKRRNQHTCRSSDGLDDDCGDRLAAARRDDALEIVGKLGAVRRLSLAERIACEIVRVCEMIDVRQQLRFKCRSIGCDASNRNSAKANAVVPAEAADEAHSLLFATCAVIRERHLERRIDCLAPRIREEDTIDADRQHC